MYHFEIYTAFGLESVVGSELKALGIAYTGLANGILEVKGDARTLAVMQIWLRTAERISLVLDRFPARDFDELFEAVLTIPWEEILPWDAKILVSASLSPNALINSARNAQSITKKAIIERLKRSSGRKLFPETGKKFSITISLAAETGSLLLDATGDGLHRRGYRLEPGSAPLRETTAAALVLLSGWVGLPGPDGILRRQGSLAQGEILWDPCCGSGTIAIEAAMLAADRAPGLMRYFASEDWGFFDQSSFEEEILKARDRALKGIETPGPVIRASDLTPEAISITDANLERAGMAGRVKVFKADARELVDPNAETLVITNPPYGERLGDEDESDELVRGIFASLRGFKSPWRVGIITDNREINQVVGQRYLKNRKFYNGKIPVWLCWFERE